MLVIGALSGPLPKVGIVVAAALAAVAMLHRDTRVQALAMLGALVLAPILLLGDIWHSPQLGIVHRHPLVAAVGAVIALAAVAAAAVLVAKRPEVLAGAVIVALPFRIPISAGGVTSNLLVPLYFVVAAGVVGVHRDHAARTRATGSPTGSAPPGPRHRTWHATPDAATPPRDGPIRWLEWLLAGYVVLYALQAAYSPKFTTALQQVVFFYVPFALAYCLLRRLDWTQRLTRTCLALLAGLAVLFALVGFVEYETKTIFLNPKLIAANQLHAYFTVNSVFFDPNIFGRFLALVMILLAVGGPVRAPATDGAGHGRGARDPVGGAAPDPVAVVDRGAPRRPRNAGRGPLEGGSGGVHCRRRGRARGGGDRDHAHDVRPQPGTQRRLERPSGPRHRRPRSVQAAAAVGLRIGVVRDRVRCPPSRDRGNDVRVAHDPGDDRRRAGADRRAASTSGSSSRRWSCCSGGAARIPLAWRSPQRSSRCCSTRCCTPTSSRTRSRGRCSRSDPRSRRGPHRTQVGRGSELAAGERELQQQLA